MSETIQNVAPVVQSVVIRSTPDRIFALLTEADELVKWMPDAATFEARPGGAVRFEYPGDTVVTGRVEKLERPHAVAYTWTLPNGAETQVEFRVTDLGDGSCRVEVVHSGWEAAADLRGPYDRGWAHFLGCLGDLAEGRPVDKRWE